MNNVGDKKRVLNKLGKENTKTNELENITWQILRVIKRTQVQSGRDKFRKLALKENIRMMSNSTKHMMWSQTMLLVKAQGWNI